MVRFLPKACTASPSSRFVALTVPLATELGPLNINVNAIALGHVASEAGLKIAPEGSDFHTMIMLRI